MPSPIRPSDIAATVPGQTADFCAKFKLVLITLPNLLNQFFGWALDSTGAMSDAFKAEVNPFYTGDIKWTFSSAVASGWLRAEGQAVSRTTYSSLFVVIGTTYGTGDGTTTFNVPDLRNKLTLGVSGTKALGSTGGEETHALTVAELAAHTHTTDAGTVQYAQGGGIMVGSRRTTDSGLGSATTVKVATDSEGTSTPHNTLPPYIAAYALIKV